MPIINVKFIENVVATPDQKQELVVKLTDTFAGVLGEVVRPFTYVVIEETKMYDWGIAGRPMPDLEWLVGEEYQAIHARAREIMKEAIAQQKATGVTQELVAKAYEALGTLDRQKCLQYWDENMIWVVPGHNQLSGEYRGLDEFLAFMTKVGELSGHSFKMEPIAVMVSDEYSADVTHNMGNRAEDANRKLDIRVVHVLRWKNGKVVEGRGAIFGDGTTQYDQFWSPVETNGRHSETAALRELR
jgi:4-oxalocrotonate tautomerase family enzyme